MKKCPVCQDLISPNAVSLKASCGFVDDNGDFYETEFIVFHKDCYHNYLFNPFEQLEIDITNS
jgi:hypothetical protein